MSVDFTQKVFIVSGDGLVSSGNKLLHGPNLTQILSPYGVTRSHWVNLIASPVSIDAINADQVPIPIYWHGLNKIMECRQIWSTYTKSFVAR